MLRSCKTLSHYAAHWQACQMASVNLQVSKQVFQLVDKSPDAIHRSGLWLTMTHHVVAQNGIMFSQGSDLRIPHLKIEADPVNKHNGVFNADTISGQLKPRPVSA